MDIDRNSPEHKRYQHAGGLWAILLLSLFCWLVHSVYRPSTFEALDPELSFGAALIIQMVIALGVILPAAPGYVGNFEYFTVLALGLFGVPQEVAFAYALLAHICQIVPVTAVGLFCAQKQVPARGRTGRQAVGVLKS